MKGMIDKSLDVDYNLNYLVIVPGMDKKLLDAFAFTFGNAMLFNNTVEDLEFLIEFLKQNVVDKLIFVDYYAEYDEVISTLVEEHDISFIFTGELGNLSDPILLDSFNRICEKYDNETIHMIGFLDPYLQKVVCKKRRNVKHVMLDIENVEYDKLKGEDSIGLLNSDLSNYDSFYNELCGVSMVANYKVKLYKPSRTTLDFISDFGIEALIVERQEDLFYGGVCNLFINFANTGVIEFMKSMDAGVPCIIGNNYFLSDNPVLSDYVVMNSDDDVNEIAERLNKCIDNKEKILKEYKKFRKEYSRKSKELASEFLGVDICDRKDVVYNKLLTVVVPVYNTEKYLARCLDSIIRASIGNMEILVINDGSADGSDGIIKEYLDRYPGLIRYIKQKNGGLGHVRNVGLKEARGKYLASVDSDDTISAEFLKSALPYMEKDIDMVICDWMSISEKESFETVALDWVFDKRKVMEGILYTTIMPSTCNKIIKRELFDNVCYLEKKYEDLSANPLALIKAETIKYIHRPYYNYYLTDNSLMRSKIDPKEMVDAIAYLDSGLEKTHMAGNKEELKYYTYSWRIEEYIINPLYELSGKELKESVEYIYKKINGLMEKIFESVYYRDMLNNLNSKELRGYVIERNKAIKNRRLKEFIESKDGAILKLTPEIIYYGD